VTFPGPDAPTPASFEPESSAAAARNLVLLPVASFLNDLGWELPIMLLPFFILNVLGAGALAVGVVAGVADATQSVTKIASGVLSDRVGRRKQLTVAGYALATAARAFLLLITSWPHAIASRFFDQVGKGVRTSPRDALLADSAPANATGRAFGLLRAMDSFGAAGSMLIGLAVIYLTQGTRLTLTVSTFHILVVIGVVFGLLAVMAALLTHEIPPRQKTGIDLQARAGLPREFIIFTALSVIFTLGDSSDAFLMLRSQGLGANLLLVVAMIGGFNLVYGFFAGWFGRLSDRVGKKRLIIAGWAVYAASYLGFGLSSSIVVLGLFLIPYGMYYALTEGIGRALVADVVPSGSRGAAYGVYQGALGFSALLASVIAGFLYTKLPAAPFFLGSALAALAALLLLLVPVRDPGAR
jgi:MFS family permease